VTGWDMEPGVHRWIGVLGVVNRASTDRRVLAYDAVPEELAPYLKRGRVRWPHPATLPHLRYRPLPLPMCSALVSHHGDVGEVDGLAMTAWGQVVGTGTIAIPAGAAWGAWLLAGGDQPVGMTVRDGEGEIVAVSAGDDPASRFHWVAGGGAYPGGGSGMAARSGLHPACAAVEWRVLVDKPSGRGSAALGILSALQDRGPRVAHGGPRVCDQPWWDRRTTRGSLPGRTLIGSW
jgi:hypothetical protein